ncbi:UPF0149 family protein [Pseudomonas sp. BP8]|uniref:UPF0149 family protein n=1 Tax=Pseudomonas sp. BP8 TaxID=2817864 RepID=UPI001AE560C6|nr:UPF0149 family protein [Pseudomonas sp. BP8]MBP2263892.1 uncharacterized protein [Pseudomonas sp. BP8]HDS1736688.1 UPF0149 family protein [Pseudomonas putida]
MLPRLTEKELDRLEDLLITYGNDFSVLNLAELNGFFTALASSPNVVTPEKWLPAVSGGKVPKFKRPAHEEAYTALMLRYYNDVAAELAEQLDDFEPLFEESEGEEGPAIILEEWCFGYMRATQVAQWDQLPPEQDTLLKAISLHGLEDNFELLDAMSFEQLQACVPGVVAAARALYRHYRL